MFVREPLRGERWPVESSAQYHVIEKRRIFLPGLVLFIDDLLLILGILNSELFTYWASLENGKQRLHLAPTVVLLIHSDKFLLGGCMLRLLLVWDTGRRLAGGHSYEGRGW